RPAGYEFNRELFKKRTGLAFDMLSPAEAAADWPLSFLFHPERLNRLVQQAPSVGFGLTDMVGTLIQQTWQAPRKAGQLRQIQMQTEQVLLTYLLAASVNEENGYEARALLAAELDGLKGWLGARLKTATGTEKKGTLPTGTGAHKSARKGQANAAQRDAPGCPHWLQRRLNGVVLVADTLKPMLEKGGAISSSAAPGSGSRLSALLLASPCLRPGGAAG
nr:hypothetical protein [Chitinophagaceae bacterium]